MSNGITRISDLPDSTSMQHQPIQQSMSTYGGGGFGGGQRSSFDNENNLSYIPLNIHPNPYGIGEPIDNELPPIESSPQRNTYDNTMISSGGETQYNANEFSVRADPLAGLPQQHLPSRDIPINTLDYQQDEEVLPNYVPQVKLTSDYIREYEDEQKETVEKHRSQIHREEIMQDWFSQLQFPILVALLYFLFQMPIFNTMMRKIPLLSLYTSDGNFSLMGLLFKSILFGFLFYGIQTIAYKISQ
jgi:hypothetical protein